MPASSAGNLRTKSRCSPGGVKALLSISLAQVASSTNSSSWYLLFGNPEGFRYGAAEQLHEFSGGGRSTGGRGFGKCSIAHPDGVFGDIDNDAVGGTVCEKAYFAHPVIPPPELL
jgi:hypothetical protein